jgi:O-antigen/teichoic acid export membrane protein
MLFRNTLAQAVAQVSGYVGSFILAPIMLSRLGLALFGVWAVTGGLAVWAGALDFGITRSLSRFVAYEYGREDYRGIQEVIGLGLLVVCPLVVLALIVSLVAAGPLSDAVGTVGAGEMRSVLLASCVILGAQTTARVVSSIPIGMSRMVGIDAVFTAGRLVNIAFSIGALVYSRSLETYAWANAAAEVVALVGAYVLVRLIWRRPLARIPSRARGRGVFKFAATSQVSWVAMLVNSQTDKIVLAIAISPAAAGAYEIANRVVTALNSVSILGLSAMTPMLTTRVVREGRTFFARFYTQYTEYTCALAFPIFAVVAVTARPLLRAWLGTIPPNAILVLLVLLGAYVINATTGVGTSLTDAEGAPGVYARPAIWSALLNIALTVALAPIFGLPGVLAGTALAIAVSPVLFLVRFHRRHELSASLYVRSVWRPLAVTVCLAAPAAIVTAVLYHASTSRGAAFAIAAGVGGVYCFAVWIVSGRLRLLPQRLLAPMWRTTK